jgi:hypothetical protein
MADGDAYAHHPNQGIFCSRGAENTGKQTLAICFPVHPKIPAFRDLRTVMAPSPEAQKAGSPKRASSLPKHK